MPVAKKVAMGLFTRLFKRDSVSLEMCRQSQETLDSVRLGNDAPLIGAPRLVNLDGTSESTIFTYIGGPLRGIRVGETFYAEVLPEDMTLTSESTGTVTDSADFNSSVLAYEGQVFGTTSSALWMLKDMMRHGYYVEIRVKRTGTMAQGVPELLALTIDPKALGRWWREQSQTFDEVPLPSECDEVVINVGEDKWGGPEGSEQFEPIGVRLALIPTPRGSSAKPHVAICAGRMRIAEISAREAAYGDLVRHIDDAPLSAKYRVFDSLHNDGSQYYKLIIRFKA